MPGAWYFISGILTAGVIDLMLLMLKNWLRPTGRKISNLWWSLRMGQDVIKRIFWNEAPNCLALAIYWLIARTYLAISHLPRQHCWYHRIVSRVIWALTVMVLCAALKQAVMLKQRSRACLREALRMQYKLQTGWAASATGVRCDFH